MQFGLAYDFLSASSSMDAVMRDALKNAKMAENLGFHSIWAGESHSLTLIDGHLPSPLLALASVATVTTRIRLGTGVLLLPLYNPLKLAEDIAILDGISGGRLIVGVGLGGPKNRVFYGIPEENVGKRMEEAILLLNELWSQPSVIFDGQFFRYSNVGVNPHPIQKPRPPLIIAGAVEAAADRAARLGDGWIGASNYNMPQLRQMINNYRKAMRNLGKDQESAPVIANRIIYVDQDPSAALEHARPYLSAFLSWYASRNALSDSDGKKIGKYDDDMFDRLVESLVIVGGPDECIGIIEKYQKEIGVTQLNLRVRFGGMNANMVPGQLKLLGKRILPYFADQDRGQTDYI